MDFNPIKEFLVEINFIRYLTRSKWLKDSKEQIEQFTNSTSEVKIENAANLIKECKEYKDNDLDPNEKVKEFKSTYIFNRNIKTYEDIKLNFKEKINQLNYDKLMEKGGLLSDAEINTLIRNFEQKDVFELSQLLRHGIVEDIKRTINGKEEIIYLKLIDKNFIEKNVFEVANQVATHEGKYGSRFDVTILINGLPLVQIELKKPGVEIGEAYNQIVRYKNEGAYSGLFKFIQLFIISNKNYTRYFANQKDVSMLSFNHAFYFTDEQNNKLNNLFYFADKFLFIPFLFKTIFNYMVDSEALSKLIVLRPYQIYAVQRLNDAYNHGKNGYCFHSTGSGKTLTSFKFGQYLKNNPRVDKIFFLVDRKDLDGKTNRDYCSYMSIDSKSLTSTETSEDLFNKIKSSQESDKLIIATIQKMKNVLSMKNEKKINFLKDKKVVFIFDECHRSQAGEMRKTIDEFFVIDRLDRAAISNVRFYGFTGTPIFNEQDSQENEDVMLTKHYFGDPLHTYTMKEAISDNNVLPLNIEFIGQISQRGSDKKLLLERENKDINYNEALYSQGRISEIVKSVFDTFNGNTNNKTFNAIFACEDVKLLNLYYQEFKKINNFKEDKDKLRIGAIYSYKANEEANGKDFESAKDKLANIIEEYNLIYKTPYSISSYEEYEGEIIKQFTAGDLDLLLVVDKCLTGMDFIRCKALYLDKQIKMHTLIQAVSRTNRLCKVGEKTKDCGHIISFQINKQKFDDALRHFNNDVDVYNDIVYDDYDETIEKLVAAYKDVLENKDKANSNSEAEKVEFIKKFRTYLNLLNKAKSYYVFKKDDVPEIDFAQSQEMESSYRELAREQDKKIKYEEQLEAVLDFQLDLVEKVTVNFDYISSLLVGLYAKETDERLRKIEEAKKTVKNMDVPDKTILYNIIEMLSLQSDLTNENFTYYWNRYVDKLFGIALENRLKDYDVDIDKIIEVISNENIIKNKQQLKKYVIEEFQFMKKYKANHPEFKLGVWSKERDSIIEDIQNSYENHDSCKR